MKNLKIKPVLTEKSIAEAEEGRYTFVVPRGMRKPEIGKLIAEIFEVKVKKVRTLNYKPRVKSNMMRRSKSVIAGHKKAVVTLEGKDKIDIFGEGEKKK